MPNEPNEPNSPLDPRETWRAQEPEEGRMSIEAMSLMLKSATAKAREEHRTLTLRGALLATFAVVWLSRSSRLPEQLALIVALIWLLIGQYHELFIQRPRTTPANAGVQSTLEFLRQELRRRRDQQRLIWLRFLGPAFLIIGVVVWGRLGTGFDLKYLKNSVPFLTLLGIWVIAYFVVRKRRTRELNRQLEELDRLESALE